MTVRLRPVASALSLLLVLAGVHGAAAQPLGTFRWQQQPYCNVVTVNVVQSGSIYQLDGFDDQCGASSFRASVSGIAFLNPNGTVGMGLTIVGAPGGAPLHLDSTLNLSTLNGTWRDSMGATGSWVLTPGAAVPGGVRPLSGAMPRFTRISYTGTSTTATTTSDFVKVRDLGTFTKAANSTLLRLTLQTHVRMSVAGVSCAYQLRIDDINATGETNFAGSEGIVNSSTRSPVSIVEVFGGVASGSRIVSLWVRGSGSSTCEDNGGNFTRTVLVEELPAFGATVAAPDPSWVTAPGANDRPPAEWQ